MQAEGNQTESCKRSLDCFVADAPKKKQTDKLLILFNVMDEPPPSVLFHPRGSAKGRCGTRNDERQSGNHAAIRPRLDAGFNVPPSCCSSHCLRSSPPPYPVSDPSAPITR